MLFQGVLKHNVWQSEWLFWGAYNNVWKSYGMKEHADYFRDAPVGLPGQELPANLNSYYPRPILVQIINVTNNVKAVIY